MNSQMTVQEVLNVTMNNLGAIAVPVALSEQIGMPIVNAINNLRLCVEALEKAKEQAMAAEETGEAEADANADTE